MCFRQQCWWQPVLEKVDTDHVDPPKTIKLLVAFELQMQLDILQFYLVNLMIPTWRRRSVVTVAQDREGATMIWEVMGKSSLKSGCYTGLGPGVPGKPSEVSAV